MRSPKLAAVLIVAAVTLSGGIASAVIAPAAGAATAPLASDALASAATKPVITKQPATHTASVGKTVTFTVAAKGAGLKYQWQQKLTGRAFTNLPGKTSSSLGVYATTAKNNAQYRVVVRNTGGQVISSAAKLTVVVVKPRITSQPANVSTTAGKRVSLSVGASGYAVHYQWQKLVSGTWHNLTGATSSARSFTAKTALSGSHYRVVVKNSGGSVTSKIVNLKVASTRSDPYRAGQTIGVSPSWQVKINKTSTDAWAHIKESIDSAPAPRSGYHYVLVFTDVRYTASGSATPWMDLNVEFVASNGRVYRDTNEFLWSNSIYGTNELYRNGTAQFASVVEVPATAIAGGKWRVTDSSNYPYRTAWWGLG